MAERPEYKTCVRHAFREANKKIGKVPLLKKKTSSIYVHWAHRHADAWEDAFVRCCKKDSKCRKLAFPETFNGSKRRTR